jgi:hypothetical protein
MRMMRSWISVGAAALATVVGLVFASGALAQGGSSIAAATPLPIGQPVLGGGILNGDGLGTWTYKEFYRAALHSGDEVTVNAEATSVWSVRMAFYDPSINDFNMPSDDPYGLGGAAGAAEVGGNDKGQFKFVAPSSGSWTLYLYNPCLSCTSAQTSYALTAFVRHFTSVRLGGGSRVRVGSRARITGTMQGVRSGKVRVRLLRGGHTVRRATVRISGGRFRWSPKLTRRGSYRVRAAYAGDGSHRSAAASRTVRARTR